MLYLTEKCSQNSSKHDFQRTDDGRFLNSSVFTSCSTEILDLTWISPLVLIATVSNTLAVATFCHRVTREMGTGIYRLWISIVSQLALTMIFVDLIFKTTTNCRSICDLFAELGRTFHQIYDSLTACTSIERTMLICQGLSFNKSQSRSIAKFCVIFLFLCHFSTSSYGYFHHALTSVNFLQFVLPYCINISMPFVWIVCLVRSKQKLNQNQTIYSNVKKVILSYKFTLMSYSALVVLNTPKFISLFFKCTEESYFHCIAYWLSISPMCVTLILFVLPSPKYRPELRNVIGSFFRFYHRRQYFNP